jgi:hypothetical protein
LHTKCQKRLDGISKIIESKSVELENVVYETSRLKNYIRERVNKLNTQIMEIVQQKTRYDTEVKGKRDRQ